MTVQSLGTLVTNLRLEAGHSSSPSTGINQRDQLVYILNRVQEELILDYDFPGFVIERDIAITVGGRYYNYAVDLPFDNVDEVLLIYNTVYDKLDYGIGADQYALWNSNVGFESWPITRWQHHADDGTFEVWPVPSQAPPATASSQAALIRMRGNKLVPWMVQDADMCALPSTVLVLFAAAELLAREKAADAPLKLEKAKEYMRRLRVRQSAHKSKPFVLGGGDSPDSRTGRIGIDYIPVGYGSGPGH